MKTETVHPPAARDCVRCHAPHFASEKTLLARAPQKLCGDCHDLKAAEFSKAHLGIDPAAMHCVACHAPHSSKDPKLFREQQHAPFADRSCDECHAVERP
jgi:predicted CXXCH cytochrome family protein